MRNLTDKDKPYPEDRVPESGPPESRPTGPKRDYSLASIILLLALLALLIWILAFTFGERKARATDMPLTGGVQATACAATG